MKTMRVTLQVRDTGWHLSAAELLPKIALTLDVVAKLERGGWVVTAREDDRQWIGRGATQDAAILDLLRERLGLAPAGEASLVGAMHCARCGALTPIKELTSTYLGRDAFGRDTVGLLCPPCGGGRRPGHDP